LAFEKPAETRFFANRVSFLVAQTDIRSTRTPKKPGFCEKPKKPGFLPTGFLRGMQHRSKRRYCLKNRVSRWQMDDKIN
jgi:hypothetical protein